ncbi:hypothetical protein NEUTE1DRAFT_50216, partial [Neurospora tetrasperma FGSC 2508]
INSIFSNYLYNFALIYINNILIFLFRLKKDYLTKVRKVIEQLIITRYYLDPKKYKFTIKSIKYLGFIIKNVGI